MKQPLILCILDGWGIGNGDAGDAITNTHKPHYDALLKASSTTTLDASGPAVGLPPGQMGNSEVGHMTIGAGRIIFQDLPRINQAISTGSLASNTTLLDYINQVQTSANKCVHLFGLLSDGGIHSHQSHIHALIEQLAHHQIKVKLHIILDGRDTPPQNALSYITQLIEFIADKPTVKIVTLSGRFFMMDRDNRWDRIAQAYQALQAQGPTFTDPIQYIKQCYAQNVTDEFILPAYAVNYLGIQDGDALMCGNFRADRVRQILTALVDPEFNSFERGPLIKWCAVTGLTSYSQKLTPYMTALFTPQKITHTLGEVISSHNLSQLRIAETEKYAHVSFFFNAGNETPFNCEQRIMVQSPKVTTYDQQPEMSAQEITDHIDRVVKQDLFDVIIVNYANADMVGHTGDFHATSQAIKKLDQCIGHLRKLIDEHHGVLIITADHGNADCMYNSEDKHTHTAHTQNLVPFTVYHPDHHYSLSDNGNLSNIAPTVLDLLKLDIPQEMTSPSLIDGKKS